MNKSTLVIISLFGLIVFLFIISQLFFSQQTVLDTPVSNSPDFFSPSPLNQTSTDDSATPPAQVQLAQGYVDFSPSVLLQAQGQKKILFFHAKWCPTCRQAEEDILSNLENIPADTLIIKVDYDSYQELKKKYNVTYQHTFVVIDDQGEEKDKWNGGGLKEILARI